MQRQDCMIFISHSNYRIRSAGVEKYITDIIELLNKHGIQSIHLFPIVELNKKMRHVGMGYFGVNVNGNFVGIYCENEMCMLLMQLARQYSLSYLGIHLNQVNGWNLDLLSDTLLNINLPIKIIIHDYDMICNNMMKLDGNGVICRKSVVVPGDSKCNICKYKGASIARYNNTYKFLEKIYPLIDKMLAPSEVAGQNWLKGFKFCKSKLKIRDHLEFHGTYRKKHVHDGKIRIAYVGAALPHKGINEWKSLVDSLDKNTYEFFYFGRNHINLPLVQEVYVDFQDENKKGMTEQIREHSIDFVFVWSTVQETYCYTAYEAYLAGCILLTVDYSGNVAAMISKYKCGKIFSSLQDCISCLEDITKVKSLIGAYSQDVPLYSKTNGSIKEILFDKIKDSCVDDRYQCAPYDKGRVRKKLLLTALYRWRRVNY